MDGRLRCPTFSRLPATRRGDRRTTDVNQLPEARRHIVLRYFWIDRRDLCSDESEREYYDVLARSVGESRVSLARITTPWRRSRGKRRSISSGPPPAAA
jgi:hypothetical protein